MYTTITKQVIQLLSIMLAGTDVYVSVVSVWGKPGLPGGNPLTRLGAHIPSHLRHQLVRPI